MHLVQSLREIKWMCVFADGGRLKWGALKWLAWRMGLQDPDGLWLEPPSEPFCFSHVAAEAFAWPQQPEQTVPGVGSVLDHFLSSENQFESKATVLPPQTILEVRGIYSNSKDVLDVCMVTAPSKTTTPCRGWYVKQNFNQIFSGQPDITDLLGRKDCSCGWF